VWHFEDIFEILTKLDNIKEVVIVINAIHIHTIDKISFSCEPFDEFILELD
jgi:endonuclease IV